MKLAEAMTIIAQPLEGYRVAFECREAHLLKSDFFPEREEEPIETQEEAWALARAFAARSKGRYVNIHVIRAYNFQPVDDYHDRLLCRYPQPDPRITIRERKHE